MLSIKECTRIKHQIKKFTTLDSMELFQKLLCDRDLFFRMAKGLSLPEQMDEILSLAQQRITDPSPYLSYQDAMPLFYLHLGLFGTDLYSDIRQVVVDEAQDYYPMHFHILKKLFPSARYTIMGDYNQTIEKLEGPQFYRDTAKILDKKTSCLITLNKGFRCSYEINEFSRRFLHDCTDMESRRFSNSVTTETKWHSVSSS